MSFNKFKAFTLVELLVVITIVGLLSTIVLAVTSGVSEQGRIAKGLQFSQHLQNTLGVDAVGIWNMDEASASNGTQISDISGWGNDGTLVTNNGTDSKSVPGVVNGALSFDGDGDYVDCGNDSSLNLTDMITVEVWVKVSSLATSDRIVEHAQWGPRRGYYFNTNTTSVGFVVQCDDVGYGSSYYILPADQWVHLVGYYDGSVVGLYANGALVGTPLEGPSSISPTDSNKILAIGSNNGTSNFWDGQIDEVRIYNAALTSAQVQSNYYVGLNRLLAKGLMNETEYNERLTIR
jgi:prepilin-type N-terminal cleavage/methylation domain-containing protein